ncbi:hypothetical protein EMCRGX_G028997 [Ephydatia muelleri]
MKNIASIEKDQFCPIRRFIEIKRDSVSSGESDLTMEYSGTGNECHFVGQVLVLQCSRMFRMFQYATYRFQMLGSIVQSTPISWELSGEDHLTQEDLHFAKKRWANSEGPSNDLRHINSGRKLPGASTWLSMLPIQEHGFALHKGAFRDALCLRYVYGTSLQHCLPKFATVLELSLVYNPYLKYKTANDADDARVDRELLVS